MYIYIYVYVYTYIYLHVYIYIYICVCVYISTYIMYMYILCICIYYVYYVYVYLITIYGSYPGANAAGAWGRNSESSHNHPRLLVGQKNIIFATSKQHSEFFIILLNYHQTFRLLGKVK